ncbi:uncharacterized protein LOC119743019 [Patiria miniata]|uniref:N-terminal methionine N(alpha)-acetyltransferase NatC n=1 Tax=Patiria miniata TaxID=46514 RepID=A0A914BH95_PATMI|nr:uncharacterized protein LOC119743019 [Patiria miniata]
MSGSGGVDLATATTTSNPSADPSRGVSVCAVKTPREPAGKLNVMNGPDVGSTEEDNHSSTGDGKSGGNFICQVGGGSLSKMNQHNHDDTESHDHESVVNCLATNECSSEKGPATVGAKGCSCSDKNTNEICHLGTPDMPDAKIVDKDTKTDTPNKIMKQKMNMAKEAEAASDHGMTNGCDCHVDEALLKTDEHDVGSPKAVKSETLKNPNVLCQSRDNLGNVTCNCDEKMSEPLTDLTKMVENICLESDDAQKMDFSSSTEKSKSEASACSEQGAACADLLAGMEQSFGVMGPAVAGDLDDAELEELPASLSDFVLGCHNNQYTVPPCPPNDSDINTIHIQTETGPDDHPVTLMPYKSEVQMPDIMRLITKDLSEPYSIYTYRYFIHNWPQLCFLAMHQDKCVGAIVCKLDVHKKMARRGYIAMLAVDEHYRKLQIGSSLVKKAIRAMVRGECDEVVLETEITNKPALRLYENLGFLRDKRLFRYYLNGVDALRLKLWLR